VPQAAVEPLESWAGPARFGGIAVAAALQRAVAPDATTLMGWASLGLGILAIENDFMSGTEFFMDG
jgi:hypothetical protein